MATDIEKLESYADWCILAAYFLAGLATGIVLIAPIGVEKLIAVVTIGMIGLALLLSRRYIREKIRMESTGGDGE